jgi:Flp pilus assembly protein TadG
LQNALDRAGALVSALPTTRTTKTKESAVMRVVFTDFVQSDLQLEQGLLNAAGLQLVAAEPQCGTEDEIIACAKDASALIVQSAPVISTPPANTASGSPMCPTATSPRWPVTPSPWRCR